jgi:hypothetical protein
LRYKGILEDKDYKRLCKALDNEKVLEQIRNEIEQVEINGYIRDVECYRAGLNTAVKIIDKYKGEKE